MQPARLAECLAAQTTSLGATVLRSPRARIRCSARVGAYLGGRRAASVVCVQADRLGWRPAGEPWLTSWCPVSADGAEAELPIAREWLEIWIWRAHWRLNARRSPGRRGRHQAPRRLGCRTRGWPGSPEAVSKRWSEHLRREAPGRDPRVAEAGRPRTRRSLTTHQRPQKVALG